MKHSSKLPGLLIVDDDPLIREGLALAFRRDFDIHQAGSRPAAIDLLRKLPSPPQLALIDLGLPPVPHHPEEGFHLIAELLAHAPTIRIFVLSGQDGQSNARHARALGAIDFIAKPCAPEKIKGYLEKALAVQDSERPGKARDDSLLGLVGRGPAMQALRSQILMYASIPFPVLIEGESGCGKELVASAIQKNGPNPDAPYKALNCAAIAPTLIEPTLFGYSKGAFTGATSSQSGFFEDASEGTLFLDEIGELPLDLQTKLLRVLENGEYQRVGETTTRTSHARIIAATNRNLREAVRAGTFRSDLYHRLNVFPILVPPLRELGQDKLALLEHFREYYAQQIKLSPFELDQEALRLWERYGFPGNTRELRNIVIRLTTKYPGQIINPVQLQDEFDPFEVSLAENISGIQAGGFGTPARKDGSAASKSNKDAKPDSPQRAGTEENWSPSGSSNGTDTEQLQLARDRLRKGNFNLDQHLRHQESYFITAALDLAEGNISEAAKLLGINRTTLHSRMGAHEKLNA